MRSKFRRGLEQPARSLSAEPDQLRWSAERYRRSPVLRRRQRSRRIPRGRSRPAAISSASTRASAPSRRQRQTDSRLGHRRRPQGAPAAQPDRPVAVGDQGDDRHPAGRLLDQPQRRRRQDLLLRRRSATSAPRSAAQCPEFSKVGTVEIDSSALPGPIPGCIYLGEPQPGNRYRIFLTADGFATHVKLAGIGHTRSADRAAGRHLPRPAAEPVDRVQHALLRLRARPARDADPVRDLPGQHAPSRPGTRRFRTQTSTQFFTLDSGPERRALSRARRGRSAPASKPASRTTRPAPTRPSRSTSTAATATRTSAASTSTTPPGFTATLARRPLLPGVGASALAADPATRASPSRPARAAPPAPRSAPSIGRRRRRDPPALHAGQGLPGRPLQGRPAQPRGDHARRSPAPMTSATSSSGPRSTSTRPTPRSPPSPIRCRRSSTGSRCGCARSGSTSTARTSPSTRPTAIRSRSAPRSSATRAAVQTARAHFQVANCADLPFEPKLALQLSRRHQAPRQPGAARDPRPPSPAKPTSPRAAVDAAALRSSSTTPTSGRACTQAQFAADTCPPGSMIGSARAPPRCSTSRSKDPSTCARPRPQAARPRRRPQGPDRHRPRRPRRLRQRRPAHHLRNGSRRPGEQVHPQPQGGLQGPNRKQRIPLPQEAGRDRAARGPERQARQRRRHDPNALRQSQ